MTEIRRITNAGHDETSLSRLPFGTGKAMENYGISKILMRLSMLPVIDILFK